MIFIQSQGFEVLQTILSLKEISVIAALLLFIVYLIWENRDLKKRIEKAIENHQNDLKEGNKDLVSIAEKWHQLTSEIKDIIRAR